MVTKYNVEFDIDLEPILDGEVYPIIECTVLDQHRTVHLTEPQKLKFSVECDPGPVQFKIDFKNKTDDTLKLAVQINSVTFEGMTFDHFKWANKYYPVYPEPWASEQTDPLPEYIEHSTYMGWNGIWVLEFQAPIFEWIHQVENLGWVYR